MPELHIGIISTGTSFGSESILKSDRYFCTIAKKGEQWVAKLADKYEFNWLYKQASDCGGFSI